MPDMDIDFCDERRDEVIEYVRKKYGAETSPRYHLRDAGGEGGHPGRGRAHGMAYSEGDKIAKMVPNTLNISLDDAIKDSAP